MAKKPRHRDWYAATFETCKDGVSTKDVEASKRLEKHTVLFDSPDAAYAHRSADRFKPLQSSDGKHIVNDSDYAQLPNYGKITVWGVKGKAIDWKRVMIVKKKLAKSLPSDVIQIQYDMALNKQTTSTILEETDTMYNRFANSPLAKAGGIEPIPEKEETNDPSNETILSQT